MLFVMWGVVLFGREEGRVLWDTYVDRGPWTSPAVEIIPMDTGKPGIRYQANARRAVTGQWTAIIETAEGGRIATRKGRGDYSPKTYSVQPAPWSWASFFENGQTAPAEPAFPYRICVRHVVKTLDSGVIRAGRKSCSSAYDPLSKSILD
ncbi:hypothetical protein [uncultured Roseobacter sp.]|uniref:hypothetical protein n=1 Tax=uncultured Roseobacter sp. TaxID=114847 RepID=UPI00260D42A8|nr:hypothetical protein [uncultured Roseobacter sp.]